MPVARETQRMFDEEVVLPALRLGTSERDMLGQCIHE
jgi:hypothetical protein